MQIESSRTSIMKSLSSVAVSDFPINILRPPKKIKLTFFIYFVKKYFFCFKSRNTCCRITPGHQAAFLYLRTQEICVCFSVCMYVCMRMRMLCIFVMYVFLTSKRTAESYLRSASRLHYATVITHFVPE